MGDQGDEEKGDEHKRDDRRDGGNSTARQDRGDTHRCSGGEDDVEEVGAWAGGAPELPGRNLPQGQEKEHQ